METDECGSKGQQNLSAGNNPPHNETPMESEHVNNLFEKCFPIANNERYLLPEPKAIFKASSWKIDKLQMLKAELNSAKNCLNNYNLNEWQSHTKQRNSAKDVMTRLRKEIQPELLTQAWSKFYEIASSFPLVPLNHIADNNQCFKSVHLCEAPGAFVTSLNHWLKTNAPNIQWNWIATTLNPYYEGNSPSIMIDDDRFIRYTLKHWCFGEDNTGDLMNLENLDKLVKLAEPCRDIFLVTADGSIDCADVPGEQENVVGHLHFCETVAALHLLTTGGSFVLKIFTTFECHTVCLIYLLCCCFGNVSIVKPATSKEGNSETYVACTNFKGPTFVLPYLDKFREHYEHGVTQAMFDKEDVPSAFIEKLVKCSEFFKAQQCLVIMNNIFTFKSDEAKLFYDIKLIQRMVADKYIRDYNLRKLTSGEIIGQTMLEETNSMNVCKRALQGSYNDRCEQQHLAPWEQLKSFYNECNKIKIYISADKFVKFKRNKLPEDLEISSGKMFRKVCSSRFCGKNILKIQNCVNDILVHMGYEIQFPSAMNINKLTEKLLTKTGHKILVFRYTDVYDSHEIISKIHDALQDLNSGETLILVGYSLLTHLSVGLLYIISCAFNSLKLEICSDLGSKITLQKYSYSLKILKWFLDIKAASSDAQMKGKSIVKVIPASFLYECDLFFSIMDVNHWVIKSFVHYTINTLKGNMSNKESDS